MINPMLAKYAKLLVEYSISVQPGEKVLIDATTLAEPLVKEVYREVLKAGGHPMVRFQFAGQERIFYKEANKEQLEFLSPLYKEAIETYDCYLYIRAPFSLTELANTDGDKQKIRSAAAAPWRKIYSERTATRSLKRSLCEYPTLAFAQNAGMSLEEYTQFIFKACKLYETDPKASWIAVREFQQQIVDKLNAASQIRYVNEKSDISFSTEGRTWINSDGQTNMPSGEVYTSPVEESVNGVIFFNYPSMRMGQELQDVTLWVEQGEVVKWQAKRGQNVLDKVFQIEGARHFGEAAIGTNMDVQRAVKNILFDEKIGGTVHMAIGQSYLQTGGKNQSSIHWDFVTDMKNGGEIYADDELIYKNGKFLFVS